ncbi:MAG: HTTM domain-containing protein, partial [Planctomycetota bacterium]
MTKRGPTTLIIAIGVVVVVCAVGMLLWRAQGPALIEASYEGGGLWPLNDLLAHRREQRPEEFTLDRALGLVRAGMVGIAMLGGLAIVGILLAAQRHALVGALGSFSRESSSPVSLAVVRIVVFGLVLNFALKHQVRIEFMAGLPENLIVPPFGLGPVLEIVPISPGLASAAVTVTIVACIAGIIGLCARVAALVACIAAVYAFGIPHLFGKVDHHHHLVWFLGVLAASPCADVLSIDAIIRALRRGPKGEIAPPGPSPAYGQPLRLIWVLIGIIYFFPGMWKLVMTGPEWITGDAMQHVLWRRWHDKQEIGPRIDQWPLLYRAMGAGAIAFEIGFLWMILFRRTRWIAVPIGFGFHLGTRFIMGIKFTTLLWSYSAFVAWDRVFDWVGRVLFRDSMIVAFDGGCGLCRRTAAVIGTIDILRRIEFVPVGDERVVTHAALSKVPEDRGGAPAEPTAAVECDDHRIAEEHP